MVYYVLSGYNVSQLNNVERVQYSSIDENIILCWIYRLKEYIIYAVWWRSREYVCMRKMSFCQMLYPMLLRMLIHFILLEKQRRLRVTENEKARHHRIIMIKYISICMIIILWFFFCLEMHQCAGAAYLRFSAPRDDVLSLSRRNRWLFPREPTLALWAVQPHCACCEGVCIYI